MSLLLATGLVFSQLIGFSTLPALADTANPTTTVSTNDSPPASSDAQTTAQTQDRLDHDDLTIDDVKVEGNRLVPTEDILGVVKTHRGDKFDRDKVVQDLKAINGMGYFDDRNLQVVPELTSSGVLLKIRVQENEPVTQFAFQGNTVLSADDISKVFADQLGKPQNLNQLSQAIDKVEQTYHEKGYLLARVMDVKDDPDGSISLTISEGTIDKIVITGNRKTKDFIIRNAIKVKPGDVYNERLLTADLRKLYGNGYFQDIRRSLAPNPDDPDKYTLKVEVDEKRTGSVGVGGGVDTSAGPFGSLTYSDGNFRGRGEMLNFTSQVGTGMFNGLSNSINNGGQNFLANQKTYQVQATYVMPNILNSGTSMAVSGFGRDLNSMMVADAMQRSLGSSVTFTHKITDHLSASLGFLGEDTTLKDVNTLLGDEENLASMSARAMETGLASNYLGAQQLAANTRALQLKGGTYFSVSPTLNYDTRNNMADPTSGMTAKLTASPSLGLNGTGFVRLGASVSKYYAVTDTSTLAFNVQGGEGIGSMPQFANFRLGGFNGIRGYRQFSDLGTGSSMLMGTAEYRFKLPIPKGDATSQYGHVVKFIQGHVKGEIFSDVGEVGGNNTVNDLTSASNMGASVGAGLRFNVPMLGVIRIDYGFPLISSVLGHMTPRFSIGFGNNF